MDNHNCDSSESVTLVLRDSRVEANKNKLARSSLYFASLFSEHFKDHRQKEFAINYEISLGTLQDFLAWINNEENDSIDSVRYNFTVKKSLQKFLVGKRSELLELLELSVVFLAEKLTEDITEMIICMRLPPDVMLETWLLAENLGLKGLANVALAICLDKFAELSVAPLTDLPLEHFTKLLCNVNIKSSVKHLMNVREAWIERNGLPNDVTDSSSRFIKGEPEDVIAALEKAKSQYSQCVIGHKLNKALFIYSWNDETLQELTEIGKDIIGRRVVARGFNIYVVGRKQGANVGHSNTTIWRYCIFTKKLYTETILPRRRQNMALVCLENNLYLFGGTDSNKVPISAVDVYNLDTGVWSQAAKLPETRRFTEVRSWCVANDKIIYKKARAHVYFPRTDHWDTYYVPSPPIPGRVGREFANIPLFIGSYIQPNTEDVPLVYARNWLPQSKRSTLSSFILSPHHYLNMNVIYNWGKTIIHQQVLNGPYLVSFGYSNGQANVEVGKLYQTNKTATYQHLKTCCQELRDVPANCFQLDIGCFNLIEPTTLHTTITMPETMDIGNEFTAVRRKRKMKNPEKLGSLK